MLAGRTHFARKAGRGRLWAALSATVALAIRQRHTIGRRVSLVLLMLLAVGSAEAQAPKVVTTVAGGALAAARVRSDLRFEPNVGQAAADAEFLARGRDYLISLRRGEVRLALPRTDGASKANLVQLKLVGADSTSRGEAQGQLASKSHYFQGNDPRNWRPNVPQFAHVRYESVYPGVDLEYQGNAQQLEFTFVLRPGVSPGKIAMAVEGARRLSLDPAGELLLELPDGQLRILRPLVYQEVAGRRRKVDAQYVLERGNRFGFRLADFDPRFPLVIDPVLNYSTYLGGSSDDEGLAVAADSAGNAYVTGFTNSANFPATPGALRGASTDVFVSKFDPAGALVYSTYLGGSGQDKGNSIAVDASGNVHIGGETNSFDLPVPPGALQASNGGTVGFALDGFVASLSADGSALRFATYLGGNGNDQIFGLALDSSGNVLVTGFTNSPAFPVRGAFQSSLNGSHDAFVAKLDAVGSRLIYSTYFGGSSRESDIEHALGIAADSTGAAYIVGRTTSTDLPTRSPVQASLAGGEDAFVAKFDASGSLVYSTYLGGSLRDQGLAIATDALGGVYVTGLSASLDFPVVHPLQPLNAGGNDIFVTKIDQAGSPLTFSTYLGGSGSDAARGIALDRLGGVYLTGTTTSTNFPTVDPIQGLSGGGQDVFLAHLNVADTALVASTYLGGIDNDNAFGVAVDAAGSVYLTGRTASANFPTVNAVQPMLTGGRDAFVVRFTPAIPAGSDLSLTASGAPDPSAVGSQITYSLTVTDNGPAAATHVVLSTALPASANFVSASASQGSCFGPSAGTSGTVNCDIGSIVSGAQAAVSIVITPTVAGPLTVLLSVVADEPDAVSNNNVAVVNIAVLGPVLIDIAETIAVTDTPAVRPSALLNITEQIVVQDAPTLLPSAMLAINESVTVTDLPAPRPSAMLFVAETISVSDTPQVTLAFINTVLGLNVVVAPVDVSTGGTPVTMIFANVTQPGQTSLQIGNAGPPPPPGFVQGTPSLYYDLTTTAAFTGLVQVCVTSTGTSFTAAPFLWHYATGVWVNITTVRDVANQKVCGDTLSLSPFALFAPANQSPSLTMPATVVAEATSAAGASVAYSVTAQDREDGPLTPACVPASGTGFPLGATTVSCTATDSVGAQAHGNFSVSVRDTIAPQIAVPDNQSAVQTSAAGAIVNYPAPAIIENGSGLFSSGCSPLSGSVFPPGVTTVTCTVTDRSGNSGSATFTVTVTALPASDGRMHGAGHIDQARMHHHFVSRVAQMGNQGDGRLEYWVNASRSCQSDDDYDRDRSFDGDHDRDYHRDHRSPAKHFEASAIRSVIFSDVGGSPVGRGSQAPSKSVRFSGTGTWNGRPGYTFEASATDNGEPGRTRDLFSLVVKDARGAIVANVSGDLDGGNIQFTRLGR